MIETVFFDGDQTLWDFHTLMRRALEATLQELRSQRPGPPGDAVTVESMIADRDQVAAELRGRESTMEAIRVAAFGRTLDRIGLPDPELADHLAQHYFEHRFGDVLLYDDVRPTLTLLAEDYQLGLLTRRLRASGRTPRCGRCVTHLRRWQDCPAPPALASLAARGREPARPADEKRIQDRSSRATHSTWCVMGKMSNARKAASR